MTSHLNDNLYCNLASVSNEGRPWNTPLFFVHKSNVLYWWSPFEAVHSKNIIDNSRAFITVYDSNTPIAKGDGVCLYLDCSAQLVESDELESVIKLFNEKVKLKDFFLSIDNTTGDADKEVKCPKCDSTDFEKVGGIVMMFD